MEKKGNREIESEGRNGRYKERKKDRKKERRMERGSNNDGKKERREKANIKSIEIKKEDKVENK